MVTRSEVWPVVMVTGHRPQHLTPAQQAWCRTKLAAAALWCRDQRGTTTAISGMALGADTLWAQAALDAGLDLHAYLPFPEQAQVWRDVRDREEWTRLLSHAALVKTAGELGDLTDPARKREAVRLLHVRNEMMLADSTAVISVLDVDQCRRRPPNRRGGTWSATRKAVQRGLPGVHLDPGVGTVRLGLPDLRSP